MWNKEDIRKKTKGKVIIPEYCFRKINCNRPMVPNQHGKNYTAFKKYTDACGLIPDLLNQNL